MSADSLRAELFGGLREQAPDAQQRFWQEHWEPLCAICSRVLGDPQEGADVATTALVDFLFRYVQRLEQPAAAVAYLRLMATRRALKRRDQLRQRRVSESETETEGLPDPVPCASDDAALRAVLRPRLNECMQRLTPKARQVLALRFHSDMTNESIGQLVGGSKQYIGKLLAMSLQALRACLTKVRGGRLSGAGAREVQP